ncbi:DUF1353 domain-containing protein [uncultured Brevundimonas sp.]|uniref:DUF1353 domain-containing protein n=1 Tax=uncultured Brevundimonas sp. TaxID=213418 RepID=UPI00262B6B73|nr:DUF1353 domain-containing protein [uncultured Brevundimonas sp.]
MIGFDKSPSLTIEGKRRAVLNEPLAVSFGGTPLVTIPAGYATDGMSRRWWMPSKWGRWHPKYLPASILHDYLLTDTDWPKWQIDWLFMGALRATGVSAHEAGLFWLAVRTRRRGANT